MRHATREIPASELGDWKEANRRAIGGPVVHDLADARAGWTRVHLLELDGRTVGFGTVGTGGPWRDRPTVIAFHLDPGARLHSPDLFVALVAATGAVSVEAQENDPLLPDLLGAFSPVVRREGILFVDGRTTSLAAPGSPAATFRAAVPADRPALVSRGLDSAAGWLLETRAGVVAAGGILARYNAPYRDLYMRVAERFRGKGLGSYLVQELKRECRAMGAEPAARCAMSNLASRVALLRAGMAARTVLLRGDLQ